MTDPRLVEALKVWLAGIDDLTLEEVLTERNLRWRWRALPADEARQALREALGDG